MEVKPVYKQREVGAIPEDWQLKRLGELGSVVRGGSPRPAGDPRYFDGQFIPWLTVAALTNIPEHQLRVTDTAGFLTEEGAKHSRTLECGTLIIANSGATLGVAKVLNVTCCANDGIAAIVNQTAGDKEFICHYINSRTKHLREVVATGNGQPNLNTTLIREMPIPFPPPPEQRAIAGALSDVDALLCALDQLIAKKRDLKQATMQELLTGQTRLPGFSGEWEVKQLGDVVEIKKGELITEKEAIHGNIPVIAGGKKPSYFHNRANRTGKTITISSSGASAGYVSFFETPIFASDCSTISEGPICAIQFIYFFLHLRQEEIYRLQTGGAQPHIHPNDLRPMGIRVPQVAEQTAIAEVLSDMDAELAALELRRDKTRALKQGMMQELLTGRTRLSVSASSKETPQQTGPAQSENTRHNWAFNEAVVIAVLANKFGSREYPLGRLRYTKLAYLMHRHVEGNPEGYLKKAAGPYNPATRYKGPESIAQKNGYVRAVRSRTFSGFVSGENVDHALIYFRKWYGGEVLEWVGQFRYEKNEALELLATVDMAILDLRAAGKKTTVENVKGVLRADSEWKPKLRREVFSDTNIKRAIAKCQVLFG